MPRTCRRPSPCRRLQQGLAPPKLQFQRRAGPSEHTREKVELVQIADPSLQVCAGTQFLLARACRAHCSTPSNRSQIRRAGGPPKRKEKCQRLGAQQAPNPLQKTRTIPSSPPSTSSLTPHSPRASASSRWATVCDGMRTPAPIRLIWKSGTQHGALGRARCG